ncbi:MAG: phosphatase PAP2 family protein [Pseudomonadota bacterium]
MKLPFFNNKDKPWVGILGILAFLLLYLLPNHIQLFNPMYLPSFEFENNIPFIDWTIWFYMSDYLCVAVVFILLKDRENMNRIFYSQILALITAMLIFFVLPTTYPRPMVEYNGISGWLLKFLHSADTPGNACPSVHVAVTFIAAFGFIKEQRRKLWFFILWAAAISLSTLTVKQHYVVDVIAGFLMAVIFYIFVAGKIKEYGNINFPK